MAARPALAATGLHLEDSLSGNHYQELFRHSSDFVCTLNLQGGLTSVNPAGERLTGYTSQELLATRFYQLLDQASRDKAYEMLLEQFGGGPSRPLDLLVRTKTGRRIDVTFSTRLLFRQGRPHWVLGMIRPSGAADGQPFDEADADVRDPLTGLLNTTGLTRLLQAELASNPYRPLAIVLIKIQGLRLVNQALGFAAGDRLIETIARRLTKLLDSGQAAGRIGGNSFALIWPGQASAPDLEARARRLLHHARLPLDWEGSDMYANAGVGIALYPRDAQDAVTLLRHAETATEDARRTDAPVFYVPTGATQKLELNASLHRALENGELRLRYQPQADNRGRLECMEVLLGWQHPGFGLLPARDFLPVAEESGFIVALDQWVLRQAGSRIRAWQRSGLPPVRLSVNVSARQFDSVEFVPQVVAALEDTGLDPAWLELEVTEHAVMRDLHESSRRMKLLRSLGIRFAIDDFGTGYSSLSYLKRLPVDTVKIDRTFVEGIELPAGSLELVQSIIDMVHLLGMKVVAEGVENLRQWRLLAEAGCDRMQGHLLGLPVEEQLAEELLRSPGRRLLT